MATIEQIIDTTYRPTALPRVASFKTTEELLDIYFVKGYKDGLPGLKKQFNGYVLEKSFFEGLEQNALVAVYDGGKHKRRVGWIDDTSNVDLPTLDLKYDSKTW